jgi:hypothetical protein
MRGSWCVKCLEGDGRGVVTRASAEEGPGKSGRGRDPITVGKEFAEWVRGLLDVVEVRLAFPH